MLARLGGLVWIACWVGLLYLVAAPWRDLGGVVSERLRWLESFVLFSGPVVGFAMGNYARETGLRYRILLYPPAVLTATALVVLRLAGEHDPIGVVFTGFLAYWAGLDFALGALPLLGSRHDDGEEDAGESRWPSSRAQVSDPRGP